MLNLIQFPCMQTESRISQNEIYQLFRISIVCLYFISKLLRFKSVCKRINVCSLPNHFTHSQIMHFSLYYYLPLIVIVVAVVFTLAFILHSHLMRLVGPWEIVILGKLNILVDVHSACLEELTWIILFFSYKYVLCVELTIQITTVDYKMWFASFVHEIANILCIYI